MASSSDTAPVGTGTDVAVAPARFLLFRLWGPMAAWGDITVGERRTIWSRPSRSGVLGLVAACLGIPRTDGDGHKRLEAGLGLAIRVDDPGRPLRDYHTAQSPSAGNGKRWSMRRDELDRNNDINTILSERTYQVEAGATIVLWPKAGSDVPPLDEIAVRLDQPVFTPCLGRKACPLGLPPAPHLSTALTLDEALAEHDARVPIVTALLRRPPGRQPSPELWLALDDAVDLGLRGRIVEHATRRDGVRDRPRRIFADRAEVSLRLGPAPEESAP